MTNSSPSSPRSMSIAWRSPISPEKLRSIGFQKDQGYSGLAQFKYAVTEKGEQITVGTELLDEQLPPGYVPALIKIDVEGGEYAVLRGAQKTLERYRPVLVIEYPRRGIPMPGISREDLYDFLVSRIGYRMFDMFGHGPLSRAEFGASPAGNFVLHV